MLGMRAIHFKEGCWRYEAISWGPHRCKGRNADIQSCYAWKLHMPGNNEQDAENSAESTIGHQFLCMHVTPHRSLMQVIDAGRFN